jgi:hypothetical protein
LDEQATETAGVRVGKRTRTWWSTWWPFGLAWPATALLIVLGATADDALDSRFPLLILFPFAAAVCTTELHRSVLVALTLVGQLPLYALLAKASVRRRHSRTVAAAVATLRLTGIALGSPLFWGPSLSAFGRRLAEAAGPGARHCGVVPLIEGRAAAISCSRIALAARRPFSVAFQVMGIDSTIYEGLAFRGPGQATHLVWDSDVSGGYSLVPRRRVYQSLCVAPAIENRERTSPVTCSERRVFPLP